MCAAMKANITLKLDSAPLRGVKILAAEQGSSISTMLAERLEQIVGERKAYDQARRRALTRLREATDHHWTKPTSRDDLHKR